MDVEELSVQLSGKLDISITSVTTGDSDDSSTQDDVSEDVSSATVSSSEASTANSIKQAMSSSMAELQAVASTQHMKLQESSLTKVTIKHASLHATNHEVLFFQTFLMFTLQVGGVDDDGANPPKSGFARKVISVARSLSRSRSPSPLRVGKTPPPTERSEEEEEEDSETHETSSGNDSTDSSSASTSASSR